MTKKIVTKKSFGTKHFCNNNKSLAKKNNTKNWSQSICDKNSEQENISRQNIVTLIFLTTQVVSTTNKIFWQNYKYIYQDKTKILKKNKNSYCD